MKCLIKNVNEKEIVKEIDNDLKSLQNIVEGHIETLFIPNDIVVVCNEEGRFTKDFNCYVGIHLNIYDFYGNIAFLSYEGGDFKGLNDEQIEYIKSIIN